MAKKPKDDADELFKNAPQHVKDLHKKSKRLRREVERKNWWHENKHRYGKD